MDYKIIHQRGYFEVCDQDGLFVLSADTETEANHEIEEMVYE